MFFLRYLAIVSSTVLGSDKSALCANALRFLATAIKVFLALPFLSKCKRRFCILGIAFSKWLVSVGE